MHAIIICVTLAFKEARYQQLYMYVSYVKQMNLQPTAT